MAQRDYKNGGTRQSTRAKKKTGKGNLLVGVLIGVLMSVLLAGVALWLLWPRPKDFRKATTAPVLQPQQGPAPTVTGTKSSAPNKINEPSYTFYDILPGNRTPKPLPAKQNRHWWLQIAALQKIEDADALRARLILLNFDAVVEPAFKDGKTLYRVRVGPFDTQAAAENAQNKLTEDKFQPSAPIVTN